MKKVILGIVVSTLISTALAGNIFDYAKYKRTDSTGNKVYTSYNPDINDVAVFVSSKKNNLMAVTSWGIIHIQPTATSVENDIISIPNTHPYLTIPATNMKEIEKHFDSISWHLVNCKKKSVMDRKGLSETPLFRMDALHQTMAQEVCLLAKSAPPKPTLPELPRHSFFFTHISTDGYGNKIYVAKDPFYMGDLFPESVNVVEIENASGKMFAAIPLSKILESNQAKYQVGSGRYLSAMIYSKYPQWYSVDCRRKIISNEENGNRTKLANVSPFHQTSANMACFMLKNKQLPH